MAGVVSKARAKGRFYRYLTVATFCAMQLLPRIACAVPPAISAQPVSQGALLGSNATFIVTAAASPMAYQWLFNGGNLSGATNSILIVTNVQAANAGAYKVVLTNASGMITSSPATLAIVTAPDFL